MCISYHLEQEQYNQIERMVLRASCPNLSKLLVSVCCSCIHSTYLHHFRHTRGIPISPSTKVKHSPPPPPPTPNSWISPTRGPLGANRLEGLYLGRLAAGSNGGARDLHHSGCTWCVKWCLLADRVCACPVFVVVVVTNSSFILV
jgi:hypothetical protein